MISNLSPSDTSSSNRQNPRYSAQYVAESIPQVPNLLANTFASESITMGDAEITASSWRLVEVGRIVLITGGPSDGKLATIVEIIDHKRVCGIARNLQTRIRSTDSLAGSRRWPINRHQDRRSPSISRSRKCHPDTSDPREAPTRCPDWSC